MPECEISLDQRALDAGVLARRLADANRPQTAPREKPSAVVMAYTGHSDYSADEPCTFVVVGEQDGIAPPSVMERRVAALRRTGTEVEFHRYSGVGTASVLVQVQLPKDG